MLSWTTRRPAPHPWRLRDAGMVCGAETPASPGVSLEAGAEAPAAAVGETQKCYGRDGRRGSLRIVSPCTVRRVGGPGRATGEEHAPGAPSSAPGLRAPPHAERRRDARRFQPRGMARARRPTERERTRRQPSRSPMEISIRMRPARVCLRGYGPCAVLRCDLSLRWTWSTRSMRATPPSKLLTTLSVSSEKPYSSAARDPRQWTERGSAPSTSLTAARACGTLQYGSARRRARVRTRCTLSGRAGRGAPALLCAAAEAPARARRAGASPRPSRPRRARAWAANRATARR